MQRKPSKNKKKQKISPKRQSRKKTISPKRKSMKQKKYKISPKRKSKVSETTNSIFDNTDFGHIVHQTDLQNITLRYLNDSVLFEYILYKMRKPFSHKKYFDTIKKLCIIKKYKIHTISIINMKTAIEYADEDDLDIYTIGNFTEYKTLDDMNKNYTNENSNIIIDCENITWIYLTDNNWTTITDLIKEKKYENISFFGPVTKIFNNWISQCQDLKSVNFSGLHNLQEVYFTWLFNCENLENVDFTGLHNLNYVEDNWLADCYNLKNINFKGLKNLNIIGANWLSDCKNLENADFSGLKNLKHIRYNWLKGCDKLKQIDLTKLTKLISIESSEWFKNNYVNGSVNIVD